MRGYERENHKPDGGSHQETNEEYDKVDSQ